MSNLTIELMRQTIQKENEVVPYNYSPYIQVPMTIDYVLIRFPLVIHVNISRYYIC